MVFIVSIFLLFRGLPFPLLTYEGEKTLARFVKRVNMGVQKAQLKKTIVIVPLPTTTSESQCAPVIRRGMQRKAA